MIRDQTSWVLAPVVTMNDDQRQRWQQHCFQESDVDALLQDPVRSVVISTYGGCGITTSLALLQQTNLLVFTYNPNQWPGQPERLTDAPTHFAQWMACVADKVTVRLQKAPADLQRLNLYQHQFLLWLLQRYLGDNQRRFWRNRLVALLPKETAEQLTEIIEHEPVSYGDTIADIKYQIHETISLAESLGWQGIFASIDLNWWDWFDRSLEDRARLELQLHELLTTLAPLEIPSFGVKLGLAGRMLAPQEIDRLTRSRIKPMIYPATYAWSHAQLHRMCIALVELAAADAGLEVTHPPEALWTWLAADLVSIWDRPCPAAAKILAAVWINLAGQQLDQEALHLELRAELFRGAAFLRRDPRPGSQLIYRGQTEIHLDDTLFRVFELLWKQRGDPASNDTLLLVAGTKTNLDKIISRLREQIEPFYRSGLSIYIQRRQNGGTWIDRKMTIFS